MQDEEYPAYLKKQSYDNLVAISWSIDKEATAKRYEMVLAEVAERDKLGEKPQAQLKGQATLYLGSVFIFLFVIDMIRSRAGWTPTIHLVLGIVCLSTAWISRRKKDKNPPA